MFFLTRFAIVFFLLLANLPSSLPFSSPAPTTLSLLTSHCSFHNLTLTSTPGLPFTTLLLKHSSSGPDDKPLASLTLVVRPGFPKPILHLDAMRVSSPPGLANTGTLGLGLLLGCAGLCYGLERGCGQADFLAIDDEDFQHKRLVKYYRILGLSEVRYVGGELKDVPDRMTWGGVGTLMRGDIAEVLGKWEGKWEKKWRREGGVGGEA